MTEPPVPTNAPRLRLGQLLATPAATATLAAAGVSVFTLLNRHARGDWGDISEEDHEQNNLAAIAGQRVLSSYLLPTGQKIRILTEWDRSVTTVLLPDDC
ncbi:hypothetical protein ACS7SF_17060 [Ralstonia sp. 25C]|uniref:hypothetical protein n=1 Tax=Ralstonia sp. 25C TaxID=3447363 RepID=UPI003F74CDAB